MNRLAVAILSFVCSAFFSASITLAQDNDKANIGLPPNGVFSGSSVESVQVNNGNLHIEIPLYSVPGRGLNTTVSYVYDSRGWSVAAGGRPNAVISTGPGPHNNLQWSIVSPTAGAAIGLKGSNVVC